MPGQCPAPCRLVLGAAQIHDRCPPFIIHIASISTRTMPVDGVPSVHRWGGIGALQSRYHWQMPGPEPGPGPGPGLGPEPRSQVAAQRTLLL